MRILHLLSQVKLSGSEVYAANLCRRQMRDGHDCLIVSDTLSVDAEARYIPMAIHNRSWPNRLRNLLRLIALVKRDRVDLIHAHSRAASWLANIVARRTGIAYVSTVHGRQFAHATSRRFNIYGGHIIAICDDIGQQLHDELHIRDVPIRVIPNGID